MIQGRPGTTNGPTSRSDLSGADVLDHRLLARFVADHDEAAFAALVERHGPMVWSVCRRFLDHREDIEDAFQAVFFVLAGRAALIRKQGALEGWLCQVAYRTAVKARRSRARRDLHEKQAVKAPRVQDASSEAVSRELQRALDEEVQRLGEKYQAAFVLCFLEGMSRADASRELGCTEGALAGRLKRARHLLQRRLARRGILLSAALTAGALAQTVAGAAPPALQVSALVHALASASATTSPTAVLSPAAVALAASVHRALLVKKVCMNLAVLLTATVLVAGTGSAARTGVSLPARPRPSRLRRKRSRRRGLLDRHASTP